MKHLSFITILIVVLITSCGNPDSSNKDHENADSQNIFVEQYNDVIVVTPSPMQISIQLPRGLSYGRYENREGQALLESNLLRQYATQFQAVILGDRNACLKYLYRDALTYHKKRFPTYTEQEIIDMYFNGMPSMSKLSNKALDHGMDFYCTVPQLLTKVTRGEEVFISFYSAVSICSNEYYFKPDSLEKCIAYSEDGGKRWAFITVNEDTRGILSLRCTNQMIKALLSE